MTDRYTKAVLTIIALCLSVIAVQLTTKDAHAQALGLKFAPNGALMVTQCDPDDGPPFTPFTKTRCKNVNGEVVLVKSL